MRVLRRVNTFDLVYIYNEAALLGPALPEQFISRRGVPFVFDFDDAIFLHYTYISPVNRYLRLLKFPGKTSSICKMAAHVIVGNSYLADYARKFNPSVTVVPSTIDTDSYTVETVTENRDTPVIAWTGSYSTIQYLATLKSVFRLARY
jgi:hypothetical protein